MSANGFLTNFAAGMEIGDRLGQRMGERGYRRRAREAEEQFAQTGDGEAYERALREAEGQGVARWRDVSDLRESALQRGRTTVLDQAQREAGRSVLDGDKGAAERRLGEAGVSTANFELAQGGALGAIRANAARGAVGEDGVYRADQASQTEATAYGQAGFADQAQGAQGNAIELGRQFRDIYFNEAFVADQTGDSGTAAALMMKALAANPLVGGNIEVTPYANAEESGYQLMRDGEFLVNLTGDDLRNFMAQAGPERDAALTSAMGAARQSAAATATQAREDEVAFRELAGEIIKDFTGRDIPSSSVSALASATQRAQSAGMKIIDGAPMPEMPQFEGGTVMELNGEQFIIAPGETQPYDFYRLNGERVDASEIQSQQGPAGTAAVEYVAQLGAIARLGDEEMNVERLRTGLALTQQLFGLQRLSLGGDGGGAGGQASGEGLAPQMQEFASQFPGATVTSGRRSQADNNRVGGVANSYHLTGEAIDIVPASPEQRAQIIAAAQAQGLEVITYPNDSHLHIEPAGQRGALPPRRGQPPASIAAAPAAQGSGGAGGGPAAPAPSPSAASALPQRRTAPISGAAGTGNFDDPNEWNRMTVGAEGAQAVAAAAAPNRLRRELDGVDGQIRDLVSQRERILSDPNMRNAPGRSAAITQIADQIAALTPRSRELRSQLRGAESQATQATENTRQAVGRTANDARVARSAAEILEMSARAPQ